MPEHITQHWGDLEKSLNKLKQDKEHWRSSFGRYVDRVTAAENGSYWGRRWDQYDEILHHNGALPSVRYALEQFGIQPRIVDAGCAAGIALSELRMYMPNAELYGLDIRNAAEWDVVPPHATNPVSGEDFFNQHDITFIQESYHHVADIIPRYDVLFCVGAMPDIHSPAVLQSYILKQFYRGLGEEGIGQVLIQISEDNLPRIMEDLEKSGVSSAFTVADREVIRKHYFDADVGIWGTMTLGPKYP